MPRIMVTTQDSKRPDAPVLLDEQVYPEHLTDGHAAAQLIERIGWAVLDASGEEERAPSRRGGARRPHGRTRGHE